MYRVTTPETIPLRVAVAPPEGTGAPGECTVDVRSRETPQIITLDVAVQEPTSGPSVVLLEQAA